MIVIFSSVSKHVKIQLFAKFEKTLLVDSEPFYIQASRLIAVSPHGEFVPTELPPPMNGDYRAHVY